MKLFIPIILGTAREGRNSEKVARFVLNETASRSDLTTELIDVRDFRIPVTDNTGTSPQAQNFRDQVVRADGFIIVSPEYNHGYPGELKMMLDMLYKEYARKPVAFCGVSAGPMGGVRAVEQLRLVAIEFYMVPIREVVYFGAVHQLFGEDGAIKDSSYHSRVQTMLDELVWYAQALKQAREKRPSS